MELEYEPGIEELSEPGLRVYLRSRSYRWQRLREPIWGGVAAVVTLRILSDLGEDFSIAWWGYAIAVGAGWLGVFLAIRDIVSRRFRSHTKRELGHTLPVTTRYEVTETQVRCFGMGVEIVFDRKDLSAITEDARFLELCFGDAGLCVIPLRVFRDENHKASFVAAVK